MEFVRWQQAARDCSAKINNPRWADRLSSMFEQVCETGGGKYQAVAIRRVNKDWPLRGSITCRTEDGQEWKLHLKQRKNGEDVFLLK